MNGRKSKDPNGHDINYIWSCKYENGSDRKDINSDNLVKDANKNSKKFTIPKGSLIPGDFLYFNLTITSGNRKATDIATVKVKDQEGSGEVEVMNEFFFKVVIHREMIILLLVTEGTSIEWKNDQDYDCLLYTSDAADE